MYPSMQAYTYKHRQSWHIKVLVSTASPKLQAAKHQETKDMGTKNLIKNNEASQHNNSNLMFAKGADVQQAVGRSNAN